MLIYIHKSAIHLQNKFHVVQKIKQIHKSTFLKRYDLLIVSLYAEKLYRTLHFFAY